MRQSRNPGLCSGALCREAGFEGEHPHYLHREMSRRARRHHQRHRSLSKWLLIGCFVFALPAMAAAGVGAVWVLRVYDSAPALDALRPLAGRLAPDGFIVSLQNGLEEYRIADLIGAKRTVGAFLTFGGHYKLTGIFDLYNVLNANPVTNFSLTNGNFGTVIAVLDPRVAQVAIRFEF